MEEPPAPEPRKNIVVFSDGTGNRGAKAQGTNVWALYERLERGSGAPGAGLPRQIAFYDDGVGSQPSLPLRVLGGVFGWGLYRNVQELYTFLVRTYTPGDALYFFGFSRGAYTVRTLAGLVTRYGILKGERFASEVALERAIAFACRSQRATFAEARRRRRRGADVAEEAVLLGGLAREDFHHEPHDGSPYGVDVRFLGVWDTVDAVGLPFDGAADALNRVFQWRFADRRVSPRVGCARQALALDDERRTFSPNLWDERREPAPVAGRPPRVLQVWFAGVHTNVGGGYDKDQLAYLSLDWMLTEARREGLRFPDPAHARIRIEADPLGLIEDPRGGWGSLYRYEPRDVAALAEAAGHARPTLHASVLERLREAPLGYAPPLLPRHVQVGGTALDLPFDDAARRRAWRQVAIKRRLYLLLLLVLLGPPLLLASEAVAGEIRAECDAHGVVPVLCGFLLLVLLGPLALRAAEPLAFGTARAPMLRLRRVRLAAVRLAYFAALLAAGLGLAGAVLGLCGSALGWIASQVSWGPMGGAFSPRGLALWYGLGLLAVTVARRQVEAALRRASIDALAPLRRSAPGR